MERYFEFAGIRVRILCQDGIFPEDGILTEYRAEAGEWDYSLEVRTTDRFPEPTGSTVYEDSALRVFQYPDATTICHGTTAGGPDAVYLQVERRGDSSVAYVKPGRLTPKLLLKAMGLEHLLAQHDSFVLHASYIRYGGRAILFTAPSGTGKSTQAQLWCDHRGAELINGDRAIVQFRGSGIDACGIPFAGSSQVRKNRRLPLAAIVVLSQAPETSIHRLTGVRAFRRIWEGCSVQTWNRADVDAVSRAVQTVTGCVPVYHLACTPDLTAVEALQRELEREDAR